MLRISLLLLFSLVFTACLDRSPEAAEEGHAEPAHVEEVEDGAIPHLILSARAAERLAIETVPVARGVRDAEMLVPYATLIYTPTGEAWLYSSPEPLSFVREPVTVAKIEGNEATLTSGPAVGTQVVTVGAAELYGTEFGVGH